MHRERERLMLGRAGEFRGRLTRQIITETIPLSGEYYHSRDPRVFAERKHDTPRPVKEGESWGGNWESAWFNLRAAVPESWSGKRVVARLDFNGEAMVVDAEGCPVYGLTNGSVFDIDYSKDIYCLFDRCEGGEDVELWVEATVNHLFGLNIPGDPELSDSRLHGHYEGRINHAKLCVFDYDVWQLWLDIDVLFSLVKALPESSPRRAQVLRGMDDAASIYRDNAHNAAAVREFLRSIFDLPTNPSDLDAAAVGHAHLDVGWLWPVRESIRKAGRTFASQIALLEQYPDYVFGASQAVLYQMVKENYPALFDKIRAWVKKGRWEIQGGAWVECDCNVVSGESMVRQFIHGKNFFMDEFDVDVKNLWLPDVFGYSAAMPQILKQAGVDYFLTQKLSWNRINTMPHNTFIWRGIDGSEVITHFPPENNYNAQASPGCLVPGQNRFQERDILPEFMSLFGIGNGGGGPKEEHLERAVRVQGLNGCPRLRFSTAQGFFDRLEANRERLETWSGELYLECHRGTYTTQAETKRANRELENQLRVTEFLAACAEPDKYPREELDKIWKTMLTNQFHDIIPGSSIHQVYELANREYAECIEHCRKLSNDAAGMIFEPSSDTMVLVNVLTHQWSGVVQLPTTWQGSGVQDDNGNQVPVQQEKDACFMAVNIPALSFTTLHKGGQATPADRLADELRLENERILYVFAEDGQLARIYDKELEREMLAPDACGNRLSLYVDRPYEFDAWDIDISYESEWLEDARCESASVLPGGQVRQGIRFAYRVGNASAIQQDVFLAEGSKRLDFVTEVDWAERHRMLRVSFPVAVQSEKATFEIQYGYVQRPTHRNTAWDMARFEVPAHRYADLSERDHGVALLNNCKYGYQVEGNVLDLNLLRSPTNPDPIADRGKHCFTYALLPHAGDAVDSEVRIQAAMLNLSPLCIDGMSADNVEAPCRLEAEGISIAVIKRAEKEDCRIIRLVETQGRESSGILTLCSDEDTLVETDLLEWKNGKEIDASSPIIIRLKPFEIRTYKIK